MSNRIIEKLLNGAEVEWKPLGEVAKKISSGGTPKTGIAEYYDGEIPWLRTQEVNFGEIWDTGMKITEEGVNNSSTKWIPANCVIVAMYGATVGRVGINKIPLTTNQACANIELDEKILNYKYVFYYLSSKYEYIKSLGTGSQTNINAQIVKNIEIPIPPLEIQEKIVKTLDKFTELEATLEATLEAELALRKKQYQYYRETLLTFPQDLDRGYNGITKALYHNTPVVFKALGEIAIIGTGSRNTNEATENGAYPFFVRSQVPRKIDDYEFDETAIITAGDGVGVGKVFHYVSGKYALHQRAYRIVVNDESVNSKFLFYFIQHNFASYLQTKSANSSVTSLRKPMFEKYEIPIPELSEQQKIVNILDKFDSLTNSISEGLPKEIALRRKQYEYYREQLLDFPRNS